MAADQASDTLVRQIIEANPRTAAFQSDIRRLLASIPIPNFQAAPILGRALDRLRLRVPWFAVFLADALDSVEVVPVLVGTARVWMSLSGMLDEHGVLAAIEDNDARPPEDLEQIRCALVVVCFASLEEAPVSYRQRFASAVRALRRHRKRGIAPLVAGLGRAASLSDLVAHIDARIKVTPEEDRTGFVEDWANCFASLLVGAARAKKRRTKRKPTRKKPTGGGKTTRPRTPRSPRPHVVRVPTTPLEPPVKGEPLEEVTGTRRVVAPKAPMAKRPRARVEVFRAFQSIWGINNLLLAEHFDVLSRPETLVVGKAIRERLALAVDESISAAEPWAALTFVLLLGRPLKKLGAISIVRGAWNTRSKKLQYDWKAGRLRLPVLRPKESFAPDERESRHLRSVDDHIVLFAPQGVAASLRRFFKGGGRLARLDKSAAIDSLHRLGVELGLPLTLGRLRRSLSAYLQEIGGDVAATMVLTGDTLGLSTAPLYYTCAEKGTLERIHGEAAAILFNDERLPASGLDGLVGSRLLIRESVHHRLARCVGGQLHATTSSEDAAVRRSRIHNGLCNHALAMLMVVGGHRPTDALLEVRRFDFDLEGSGAVFQDKIVDAAHRYRFAVLATVLREQLTAWIRHLRSLATESGDQASVARRALKGEDPLFFHLSGDGLPVSLQRFADWKDSLPAEWRELPLNFGRTWIASIGRMKGADPTELHTHLGHYEAVGYPFSSESHLEPIGLASHLAPQLGALAKDAGWLCRNGLSTAETKAAGLEMEAAELGPLGDWTTEIAAHRRAIAECERKARLAGPSSPKRREEAARLVAKVVEAALADGENLKSMQARIEAGTSHDPSLRIAAHNALYRSLSAAKKKGSYKGLVPGPWVTAMSAEPTPFFPGIMRARAQVQFLRRGFASIPRTDPKAAIEPGIWDFAKCALAVAIFGFIDDAKAATEILRQRAEIVRTNTPSDLLLVPVESELRRVEGLQGMAAIAVASLARRYPKDEPPSAEDLDAALAEMLPPALVGKAPRDLLKRVCATTSVCNRIELSGMARLALDPRTGSKGADIRRQRAWLDDDVAPSAPQALSTPEPSEPSPLPRGTAATPRVRKQYTELVAMLPDGDADVHLARTNVVIPRGDRQGYRSAVIKEAEAFALDPEISSLVRCLAHWVVKMLVEGTLEEPDPANSSVKTYLTMVGKGLVAVAGTLPFTSLGEDELTELYLEVLETTRRPRQPQTARELLHFHSVCQAKCGLPEIDGSDFAEYIGPTSHLVDANMILSAEFAATADEIHRLVSESPTQASRRLASQAEAAWQLQHASGARFGEIIGLRHRDIYATPEATVLFIRPNRFRRLKTGAGRRLVDIGEALGSSGRALIHEWMSAERERLAAKFRQSGFVFAELAAARRPVRSLDLRELEMRAFERANGCPSRPHRLRHSRATIGIEAVSGIAPRASGGSQVALIFPRQLRAHTCRLGHRRASTRIRSYFHMPWLLRARAAAHISAELGRHEAASALGVSLDMADKILQRTDRRPPIVAWMDHAKKPATLERKQDAIDPTRQAAATFSMRPLGSFLDATASGTPSESAVRSHGVSQVELQFLRLAAAEFACKSPLPFFPPPSGLARRTERPARKLRASQPCEALWDLADAEPAGAAPQNEVRRIAQAHFAWLGSKKDAHRLRLPRREAIMLRKALEKCGVEAAAITQAPCPEFAGSAIDEVRIKRGKDDTKEIVRRVSWILGTVWVIARAAELHRESTLSAAAT